MVLFAIAVSSFCSFYLPTVVKMRLRKGRTIIFYVTPQDNNQGLTIPLAYFHLSQKIATLIASFGLYLDIDVDMGISMGSRPRLQKVFQIFMKLSALIELSILRLLIKKNSLKTFIFTEKN
jgi:hypothetical protein